MSREIKFRVWTNKEMLYITHDADLQLNFGINDGWSLWGDQYEEICTHKKGELMQYTGLTDRNGKEIYEGDIVKYTSRERTGTKVSYKRRGYDTYGVNSDIEIIGHVLSALHETSIDGTLVTYIVATAQTTKYESYFWGDGKRTDRPKIITQSLVKPLSAKREYEIIGSIYEHPELLEG